jgi:hypothetical protein
MKHPFLDAPPLLALPKALDPYERAAVGAFWRPNEAFVDELADALRGRRVLEVFAGNGLLAGLLAARGVDVVATSILSSMDRHEAGLYHPVEPLDAVAAALIYQERDALLMCWPTVTPAALAACEIWGEGRPIVFIGEFTDYTLGHLGGCATDDFFARFVREKDFATYQGNMMERASLGKIGPKPILKHAAAARSG